MMRRVKAILREFKEVLGIEGQAKSEKGDAEELIDLLVRVRDKLRKQKLFQLADEIRSELGRLGVVLEDHPEGTIWRIEGR